MKQKFFLYLVVVLILVCAGTSWSEDARLSAGGNPKVINFGALPDVQALPVFVASEKGYFKDAGLAVNVVRFNSAMERDVALSAGRLDGYFGDMVSPMVLYANGVPIKIAATIFKTPKDRRMFAILASPKHKGKSIKELAKEGISISSNTIADYLAVRLLSLMGINSKDVKFIEIKNIHIRLQMLLSAQVPAAILAEPLATFAERKGAKAVIDDAGADLSSTVLCFHENFLDRYGGAATAFFRAIHRSMEDINSRPADSRIIMNKECRIPETMQATFPVPRFPMLSIPEEKQVMDVSRWLKEKRIIKRDMSYKEMVAGGYIP
jgi:NitT/TauT family transport system substrate-binding protein